MDSIDFTRHDIDIPVDLYNRQSELNLNIPDTLCILGLGGIGSWVALNMALIGVKKLFLLDYDLIEKHNLNRTLFRDIDIGEQKTSAIMDLIMERRLDTDIRIFDKRIEELSIHEIEEIGEALIIDCRDVIDELPEPLQQNQHVKLGYDGLSVTVMINPVFSDVWESEENRGYQVIPSFLVPCQFLAGLVTMLLCNPDFDISKIKNEAVTLDISKHFAEVVQNDS
jgi:hypothetical protein